MDEAELWQRYQEQGDREARDRLILHYKELVGAIASRLYTTLPSSVEYDDLTSWGVLGLIDALEKFDSNRGVKFSTYAWPRIRGAMLDGLRRNDWAPQRVRQQERRLEEAWAALYDRLGRPATDEELASYLSIDVSELRQQLEQVHLAGLRSLQETFFNGVDGVRLMDTLTSEGPSPADEAIWNERRQVLAEAVAKLPEKEQMVLALYYREGLNGQEIAKVLELSGSRVSQLHSKAVLRLRGYLGHKKDLFVG